MKTICIDARLYGIQHTGIGRYVENLIKYLPSDHKTKVVLIISRENKDDPSLAKYDKIVAKYHPYAIPSQFEMVWIWWKIRPGLLHATHSSIPALWPGKLVVTFHDLIRHHSKGKDTTTRNHFFYWFKYLGYLAVDITAMWKAVKIIVPAKYWRDILARRYHIPLAKIEVTYEGVDEQYKPDISTPPDNRISPPYVVYTGNLYPHKNIGVLMQAIKLLNGRVNLVLIGARSVFAQRAKKQIVEMGIDRWVTVLGRLTDREISQIYTHGLAFVFPSLIEGFGLTGLEAMAAGLPVIAARASCLPEIYEDAALYFDPADPEDLKQKIILVLRDTKLRKHLRQRGLLQAKKYSWAKMSQDTWQIYQNVLH